ncbi:MAG: hypothetical protein ACRBN8_30940 [Nannocystales bacterium]
MTSDRRFVIEERLAGRLRLSRAATGGEPRIEAEVEGVVLEGELALGSGEFVLWSTQDCPYEETLHITLLGPRGEVLDTRDVGRPMQPAVFQNLVTLGDGVAEFDFFPEERLRLEVQDAQCGLLTHILRRSRLKLTPTDQATTHDEST